jgi:hypothetical protein
MWAGWVGVAAACAVCGGGDSEATRKALIDTTIFLSLLPLGMIGGTVLWVWRRTTHPEEPPAIR